MSSLGTWVNWSLFLFTLTTCSLVWAAIYWFISVLILDWSMQSRAQWRKGQCKPTKRSITEESIVRPLIAWCLRKQFALPESLSMSGCSVFRHGGSYSSIQTVLHRSLWHKRCKASWSPTCLASLIAKDCYKWTPKSMCHSDWGRRVGGGRNGSALHQLCRCPL